MLTLYTCPLSANGRKVLAVSHHLKLLPEIIEINVYIGCLDGSCQKDRYYS